MSTERTRLVCEGGFDAAAAAVQFTPHYVLANYAPLEEIT